MNKNIARYVLLATLEWGDTLFVDCEGGLIPSSQSPIEYDYIDDTGALNKCLQAITNIRTMSNLPVKSVEALLVRTNGLYDNYPIVSVNYDDELRVYSFEKGVDL